MAEHICWKKVSMALQGLLYVCIFKTFILALLPRKISALPPSSVLAVWVAVHLHWKRTVFTVKWNGFEWAEVGSVETTTCKDIGSGNVHKSLRGRPFWEFWPHS